MTAIIGPGRGESLGSGDGDGGCGYNRGRRFPLRNQAGDVITMQDLLYGLMMPSGNDAANAIAVHMYGSIDAFADRMNVRARGTGRHRDPLYEPQRAY